MEVEAFRTFTDKVCMCFAMEVEYQCDFLFPAFLHKLEC